MRLMLVDTWVPLAPLNLRGSGTTGDTGQAIDVW
jgi:hypothetical protein